jgi:hypothetical protein
MHAPPKRPRRGPIWRREPKDHYVEPAWVTERLLDVERFIGAIHDPCVGFGTTSHVARPRGFVISCADIVDRQAASPYGPIEGLVIRDFLHDDTPRKNILCNPPGDIFEAFVLHALAVTKSKVAVIFPTGRLNTALHGWLGRARLARCWFLTPRPSMPPGRIIAKGKKPGDGKTDFCWLVFESGHKGYPQMRSLHRDK